MSDDCCAVPAVPLGGAAPACPTCTDKGKAVDAQTVKARLRCDAMRRLTAGADFRFCPAPACPTVYYAGTVVFSTADLDLPVFQKDLSPETLVCYCYGYTRLALADAAARKAAKAEIGSFVKAGVCACEVRNPQGSCCLGNVASIGRA